jgi:hypothetical protein
MEGINAATAWGESGNDSSMLVAPQFGSSRGESFVAKPGWQKKEVVGATSSRH